MATLIDEALRVHLVERVASLETRVHAAGHVPEGQPYPYATFQKISDVPERYQGGGSCLSSVRMQIDVWDRTAIGAKRIAEDVREALDNFRGNMGNADLSVPVRGCAMELAADEYSHDAKVGIFRSRADYIIWHRQSSTPVPEI